MSQQHKSIAPAQVRKLLKELGNLRQHMIDTLAGHQPMLAKLHPDQAIGAQLEQILLRLGWHPDAAFPAACGYQTGKSSLDAHTRRLFGPQHDDCIKLKVGDEIRLVEHDRIPDDCVKAIACQEAGIVAQLKTGAEVAIDDGKYAGQIVRKGGARWIRLTRVHGIKPRIESDKGINFPHAKPKIPLLTALILKIETPEAVLNLPELLLEAMQDRSCGVMIARGDLAVEPGFTHLGDAHDKLLWLCEAAHVPVVWATQVLETLAKEGIPSRAEITDAAMADRAECVMLNKGPHVLDAVAALDDILRRMQAHQAKKRPTLRKLQLAQATR
jgi:pyruvate kinase